jgi:hypothetical protein
MVSELIEKAIRQEAAKLALLTALAEEVARLLRDKGDEWSDEPYRRADRIDDLARDLEDASKR